MLTKHTVADMLITHLSNIIDPKNPNNTDASYTTVLPTPIMAEAGKYQISLSEIQWTTTWSNINTVQKDKWNINGT